MYVKPASSNYLLVEYLKQAVYYSKLHRLKMTPAKMYKIAKIYLSHRDWDDKTFVPCGLEFLKDWNGNGYTHYDIYDIKTLKKIEMLCK